MNNAYNYKLLKYLCLAGLLLLLVPMLLLSFSAAPAADDFSYGAPAHLAFVERGSVLAAFSAALDKVAETYIGWQGTFSAIFLMAIQPAVFSEKLYFLTSFIMLFALMGGTFVFCRAFFSGLLGLNKDLSDIVSVILLLCSTQLVPSPVQAFYWFNGSVYYVFFYALLLLALALGIKLVQHNRTVYQIWLSILCLLIGGGNYVTALIAMVLCFTAVLLLAALRHSGWKKLLLPGLVLLAAFAVSFAAPGNAARQLAHPNNCGAVEAVMLSFVNAAQYSVSWLELPVLAVLAVLSVLVMPELARCGFGFRWPLLVTAFSFCIVSAMFCPPIYAMGTVGEERLLNIIYFAWLLCLAINLVWWLGWFSARRVVKPSSGTRRLAALGLGVAAVLCCWGYTYISGRGITSILAYGSLNSGEAQAYRECIQRRYEVLNDPTVKDARIEPYPGQPYLLFYSDIVNDPEAWENIDMASFYGKDSVTFNTLDY